MEEPKSDVLVLVDGFGTPKIEGAGAGASAGLGGNEKRLPPVAFVASPDEPATSSVFFVWAPKMF